MPTREERREDDKIEIEHLKVKLEKEKLRAELGELKQKGNRGRWNPNPDKLNFMRL